jgi:hypothetical protein
VVADPDRVAAYIRERHRGKGPFVAELVRTTDVAVISVVEDLLVEAGIAHQVADRNMSVVEGGIGAIQMRVLVPDQSESEARTLLTDAGLEDWLRA